MRTSPDGEADQFCRRGSYLLTLATPAEPLAFRRWYPGQFLDQIDGGEPTSWDDWLAKRPRG